MESPGFNSNWYDWETSVRRCWRWIPCVSIPTGTIERQSGSRIKPRGPVSIPTGTIERLLGSGLSGSLPVSIPTGTIERGTCFPVFPSHRAVSIPTGTIESVEALHYRTRRACFNSNWYDWEQWGWKDYRRGNPFQFQLVRLRGSEVLSEDFFP